MAWGSTSRSVLAERIAVHFLATFGRELVVDLQALEKFLKERRLNNDEAAMAHFVRVMAYYKEKYQYVPRFSHLLSAKISTVETTGWEARLYADFPQFNPLVYVPAKSTLDGVVQYSGLFDTKRLPFFMDFARRINEHPDPVYCYTGMHIVERLVYTLAKGRKMLGDSQPLEAAVSAQCRLARRHRRFRDTNKTWRSQHFSKTLVRRQQIQVFGQHFTFWELPKMLVDAEFAEQVLNCRLTPAHRQAIFDVLSVYGYTHRAYLPFLTRVRDNFIIRYATEKATWEKMKPEFVSDYPF